MEILGQRLKELRKQKRVGQKEMADLLELSLRSYQFYESGDYDPSLPNLVRLADFFQVSTDYLLGRADGPGEGGACE